MPDRTSHLINDTRDAAYNVAMYRVRELKVLLARLEGLLECSYKDVLPHSIEHRRRTVQGYIPRVIGIATDVVAFLAQVTTLPVEGLEDGATTAEHGIDDKSSGDSTPRVTCGSSAERGTSTTPGTVQHNPARRRSKRDSTRNDIGRESG